MAEDPRLTTAVRGLVAVAAIVVSAAGLIGLIADLAQIDSWITTGGPAVIRVLAYLAILGCIAVLYKEKARRNRSTVAAGAVGVISVVLIATAPTLWPAPSDAAGTRSPGPEPTTPTAPNPSTTPTTPSSRAPERTLAQWAADVNEVCRSHLTQMGLSLVAMRDTGTKLNKLANQYNIADPAEAEKYVDELSAEIESASPAISAVDVAYAIINDSAESIAPPHDTDEHKAVEAWRERYQHRADQFSIVYEALSKFVTETNRFLRAGYLVRSLVGINGYDRVNSAVLDQGAALGIVSCP